jgi:hypothetical protein
MGFWGETLSSRIPPPPGKLRHSTELSVSFAMRRRGEACMTREGPGEVVTSPHPRGFFQVFACNALNFASIASTLEANPDFI